MRNWNQCKRHLLLPDQQANLLTNSTQKRGRPATGKRSDDSWIGRTYYVRRETDLDVRMPVEVEAAGIEADKSELVDLLLSAWINGSKVKIWRFTFLKLHQGEISSLSADWERVRGASPLVGWGDRGLSRYLNKIVQDCSTILFL